MSNLIITTVKINGNHEDIVKFSQFFHQLEPIIIISKKRNYEEVLLFSFAKKIFLINPALDNGENDYNKEILNQILQSASLIDHFWLFDDDNPASPILCLKTQIAPILNQLFGRGDDSIFIPTKKIFTSFKIHQYNSGFINHILRLSEMFPQLDFEAEDTDEGIIQSKYHIKNAKLILYHQYTANEIKEFWDTYCVKH